MRLAGNSRILKVVNETRLLIRIFSMQRKGPTAEELDRINNEHHEIVKAIVDTHSERAYATYLGAHSEQPPGKAGGVRPLGS